MIYDVLDDIFRMVYYDIYIFDFYNTCVFD